MDKFVTSFASVTKKRKIDCSFESSVSQSKSDSRSHKSKSLINSGKLKQMFIDVGQKSFGKSVTCKDCHMHYIKGDYEDEKRHNSFCSNYLNLSCLPNTKGHKVLHNYDNNDVIIKFNLTVKQHLNILEFISNQVNQDLGTSMDFLDVYNPKITIYLYLYGKTRNAVGFLATEHINKQNRILLSSGSDLARINVCVDESVDNSVTNESCMGVRIIWVNKLFRRQGVAKNLVDQARLNFSFGRTICCSDIAFSQPTSDGLSFALKYTKNDKIWGYP